MATADERTSEMDMQIDYIMYKMKTAINFYEDTKNKEEKVFIIHMKELVQELQQVKIYDDKLTQIIKTTYGDLKKNTHILEVIRIFKKLYITIQEYKDCRK